MRFSQSKFRAFKACNKKRHLVLLLFINFSLDVRDVDILTQKRTVYCNPVIYRIRTVKLIYHPPVNNHFLYMSYKTGKHLQREMTYITTI